MDLTKNVPRERYSQQLQSTSWKLKAENIRIRDGHKCRLCGGKGIQLDVHHIRYIAGREPWEYDDGDLVTLCHKCHEKLHKEQELLLWKRDYFRPGAYFYSKEFDGVGIVTQAYEDYIRFDFCMANAFHYQDDNHARLYVEAETSFEDIRPATKEEIEDFWNLVGKYYSDEYIQEYLTDLITTHLLPDHPLQSRLKK